MWGVTGLERNASSLVCIYIGARQDVEGMAGPALTSTKRLGPEQPAKSGVLEVLAGPGRYHVKQAP